MSDPEQLEDISEEIMEGCSMYTVKLSVQLVVPFVTNTE